MSILKRKKPQENTGRSVQSRTSQNAPVFSYYSKRAPESGSINRAAVQDSVRLKTVSPWVKYSPSIFSLVLVVIAALYLTTLATTPRVTIASNPELPVVVQSNEVYQTAAQKVFESSLLNRSKLTIDTVSIADTLQAEFPELGTVVVTVPLFGRHPLVQTKPAIPKLVLSGSGGSFVIDSNGVPILRANQLASSVRDNLPVITDNSDTTIELGKKILPNDLVAFVVALQDQFKEKEMPVESYTFPAMANELHVRFTGKGYYIKFNTEADARQQAGTYIALQQLLDSENKTPAEYIDVRVEERAYYK